jgi:hypothetical protein
MVVTLEDPCDKDLFELVRSLSILEPLKKTYHTKRKNSSKTENNSISPADIERRCDRHLRLLQKLLARRLGVGRCSFAILENLTRGR